MSRPRSALRPIGSAVLIAVLATAAWFLWPARFGGATSMVVVQGHSMEPTLHTGDLLVVREQDHYRPGDIVVFKIVSPAGGTGTVVHRLLAIGPDGRITTRGDNRASPDNFNLLTESIVGRAAVMLPQGGSLLYLLSRWWTLALVAGLMVTLMLWPGGTAPPRCINEQVSRLTPARCQNVRTP
jgi:signal peptidase